MFCNYLLFTIQSKVAAAIAGIIQQAFSRQISSPRQPNHFRCLLRVTFRLLGCLFMSTFRLVGCFFWVIFRPVGCFFGITLENPDNEPARTEEPTLALENTRIPEERRSRLWSPIIPQERARMEEQTLDNTENPTRTEEPALENPDNEPQERRSRPWRTPRILHERRSRLWRTPRIPHEWRSRLVGCFFRLVGCLFGVTFRLWRTPTMSPHEWRSRLWTTPRIPRTEEPALENPDNEPQERRSRLWRTPRIPHERRSWLLGCLFEVTFRLSAIAQT